MTHPIREDWEKIEDREKRYNLMQQTDYFRTIDFLEDIGIDAYALNNGCEPFLILQGTVLYFDNNFRFQRQDSYLISDENRNDI